VSFRSGVAVQPAGLTPGSAVVVNPTFPAIDAGDSILN